MNKVLCCSLAVAVLLVVGESLICSSCKRGLLGKCLEPVNITCPDTKPNCFVGQAVFTDIKNFIGFTTQGCLDTATCNTSKIDSLLGVSYNTTFYCCNTDFCRAVGGASTVQLSLATSAALLFSLWNSVRC
ncbi:hypothetical protein GJAV_G00009340 [Gymnothorax javanicus]|nr:hypothetical protein GJAV_G00009340 [Gymnothorax javanicus]